MPNNPFYEEVERERDLWRRAMRASAMVAGIMAVVNAALVIWAATDRSWGAMAIAFLVGPITNSLLLVISLACTPFARGASRERPLLPHVVVSVLVPIGAVLADAIIIFAMPTKPGC